MPYVDPILYNALLQSRQGGMTELTGGRRVYPSCGCCISGNTVGVYKDPVAILEASDTDICEYTPFYVEIDHSFSATSTLQLWEVDWGDGYTTNGAWPPSGPIWHPAGGYILAGVYTIILTVTDLLGAVGMHGIDVNVIVCTPVPPILPGVVVGGLGYGPCYCLDLLAASPVWVDMQTAQLVVAGSKNPRTLRYVRDRMNGDQWQVFMGTDCGIYRYRYFSEAAPGGGNWSQVVDTATLQTLGGVNFTSMSVWEIDDSLDAPGHMCAVFGATVAGIPSWHGLGFAYTSDYFSTLDRVLYISQGFWGPGSYLPGNWRCGVCMVQGSGGAEIWASTCYDMVALNKQVWKSTNYGASWNVSLANCGQNECLVHTPYVDQTYKGQYVYSTSNAVLGNVPNHYSEDAGTSWMGMGEWTTRPMRLAMSPFKADLLHYVGWSSWGEWRAGVHTILNTMSVGCQGRDVLVISRDGNEEIAQACLVGLDAAGGWIHLWGPGQAGGALPTPGNKRGNWNTVTTNAACISIARVNYGFPVY